MFRLFISIIILQLLASKTFAQANDSTKQIVLSDSVKVDSLKPKVKPHHALLLGLDVVKLAYNLADKQKFRLETIAEYKLKENTWLSAEYGFCNARFVGNNLSYNSNSNALSAGVYKSFFTSKNPNDVDRAFVGLQLGGALASTTKATYTITDVWGSSNGVIDGLSKTVFWAGLTGGFSFKVNKKIALGWRAKGKTLINPKVFNSIAPIYIALYGKGDKKTYFDYNMYLCWHLF